MISPKLFYQQLQCVLQQEPAVVATIVRVVGSAPREVGAKMAIYGNGESFGTIGGGAGEGKIIAQALIALKQKKESDEQWVNNQLVEVDLTGAAHRETQGICGGQVQVWLEVWAGERAIAQVEQILEVFETGKSRVLVTPLVRDRSSYLTTEEVANEKESNQKNPDKHTLRTLHKDTHQFVEIIQPPPVLLIVGGGHVAVALAQSASFAGFQIAVQDDRPNFLTPKRFPQASILSLSLSKILTRFTVHSQLYVALVARGYPQDVDALTTLLRRPFAYRYVGAIGSQKRIRMVCGAMQQQGICLERLPNFYAPIGLDIGALAPEEIAISICAELIKVRRGGTGQSLGERIRPSGASTKVHTPRTDKPEVGARKRHYAYLVP